jgi:precorrin-3B synthase
MTARAKFFSRLRGACPGLSVPMQTGDGLLVRLLPTGTIALPAFAALCAAARRYGSGIIEITARGSIQVRGLTATSAPRFADAVAELRIAAAEGVAVVSDPLGGLDAAELLDSRALAGELRDALARTSLGAQLAPKVSVTVDGGGGLGLGALAADVRLAAEATSGAMAVAVAVGGDAADATTIGCVDAAATVEAAVRLLGVIAKEGRTARARDLVQARGIEPFRTAIADLLLPDHHIEANANAETKPRRDETQGRAEPIGIHPLRDGARACGIGVPFGHADASALARMVEAATAAGAGGIRTAPARALLAVGMPSHAVPAFTTAAADLGFITEPTDPRRRVIACAGAPICASAHLACRVLAPQVAQLIGGATDATFTVHISGCAKSCAHAGAAALTVVGAADGCSLIADGAARDAAFAKVESPDLPAAIARYARDRGPVGDNSRENCHV